MADEDDGFVALTGVLAIGSVLTVGGGGATLRGGR